MASVRTLVLFLVFAAAVASRAQSTVPAVSQQLPAQSLVAGGTTATIDLRNYFSVPGVTGQVAQFDTVLGKFNVELLATAAPQTVANFLAYVGKGSYTNSIIHRSAALGGAGANRIVQGGGYDENLATIATVAPIPLEYNLANARGTLAMARTSDPNSATSGWFFNVDDNTTALGTGNGGGYAVFARVLGTGLTKVDAMAAVPIVTTFSSPFDSIPLINYQASQGVTTANLVVVNSVASVPIHPTVGYASAVISYSGNFAAGGGSLVTGAITASTLSLTPLASGNTTLTVNATDTNGNVASSTFAITVAAAPVFTTQPVSQPVATAGGNVTFSVAATGSTTPAYQWQLNGTNLSGITTNGVSISGIQPANTGLYSAVATSGGVSGSSDPAILGISPASVTSDVIGSGVVFGQTHIQHPNGNYYDQVLQTGIAETITAIPGQATRTSYIDLNDDIVQVEFSGSGTLSLVLDSATASGPAMPVNYFQSVSYMKGHASIVITGADDTTNVTVFTVGRATAYDPTGAYNILLPPSSTNIPANNGSQLFQGHASTNYNGIADIGFIAISSTNGKFGGVRTADASYSAAQGLTGVYAPGVQFTGPVYVRNINATGTATPVLFIGSCSDARITGGNLLQTNGQPVKVAGLTKLNFTAGSDSQGNVTAAQINQAVLLQAGVNVTTQTVAYP